MWCFCESQLLRQSAALALAIASADPAIQNLLRSSVLLFSSVFAAAIENDNFRLRALVIDLMANCTKNGTYLMCVCVFGGIDLRVRCVCVCVCL